MARAVSIHIGVNQPREHSPGEALRQSEATAWRMAELAHEAGYRSLQVLQGEEATRRAVHEALTTAASSMGSGDTLFVSFSGHGTRLRDLEPDRDERDGWDEAWCLFDGVLVDDKLAGYWRLFDAGVRIVVVTESCYGGGMGRTGAGLVPPAGVPAGVRGPGAARGYPPGDLVDTVTGAPCIVRAPRHSDGIRASLLLLSACGERQLARDGLFSGHVLKAWSNGAFPGSFCDLYRTVHEQVLAEGCGQMAQILMLGAADPRFPLERAFHLSTRARGCAVYR